MEQKLTLKKIIGRTLTGASVGALWLVGVGIILEQTIGTLIGTPDPAGVYTASFTEQALFAMLVGIGWALPTLVYDNERIAPGLQMLIHLAIGFAVFMPVAFHLHWFPTEGVTAGEIVGMVIGAAAGCVGIWFCFYLWFRSESKAINHKLQNLRAETEANNV